MAHRKYKTNLVINEANRIVRVWRENPGFQLGTITLDDVHATIERLTQLDDHVRSLRSELIGAINRRDDTARALNEIVVRARSGIRGNFGPDSSQYEQAGGTRTSERKPRKRKETSQVSQNL
jgi:hypothetical protein